MKVKSNVRAGLLEKPDLHGVSPCPRKADGDRQVQRQQILGFGKHRRRIDLAIENRLVGRSLESR